jgi:amino acid transporter
LYYVGVIALSIGLIVQIGGYVQSTLQGEFNVDPMPGWAWSLLVVAFLAVTLYTGVRTSTRTQLSLALVSLLVVTAFFIYVIAKAGSANSLSAFKPASASFGWPGIFFGVVYGVLLFVGFESAANLAEETKNPRREIPFAVIATALLATVFFVLATYAQLVGFRFNVGAIGAAFAGNGPLFTLGAPASAGGYGVGGTWINRLLELVVLFDMLAVAVGTGVASTRGVFAMSRDRRLPAVLSTTSKRRGTPFGALILLLVLAVANIAVTYWATSFLAQGGLPHYFAMFVWDSTLGGFALIVVCLFLCIGGLVTFSKGPGALGAVLAGVIGIVITAGAIWASFYKVTAPTIYAPEVAIGFLVVGLAVGFLTKGRTPASIHLEDVAVNPDLARAEPIRVVDGGGRLLADDDDAG